MVRIGILSDTHSYLDDKVLNHLKDCDQIWHAGDIGNAEVLEKLSKVGDVRAVWGNIDSHKMRLLVPEIQAFKVEGKKIIMTHIAGYPKRYNPAALKLIKDLKPDVFVCGHSHILKIIYDKTLGHLHINPGAAGKYGLHKVRTLVRFTIDGGNMGEMEVVEMER